ncbi:MAG: hypothetical protein ABIT76_05940 [Chthoniobacterales bacterium]
MKTPLIALAACCAFTLAQALSPKPKDDSTAATQEATEQSVLPEEPLLSTPTPEPSPDLSGMAVQPLPSGGIIPLSGPTVDEQRKLAEAFRSAKTEAEENFTLADIKLRAFAAPTEREKRALLREYYQAIETHISQTSPALKTQAQAWSFAQQNRLARIRTEPDYKAPTKPAALVQTKSEGADSPDSEAKAPTGERSDLQPSLEN